MKVTDKKETYSYWRKQADDWFSKYIRIKSANHIGIVSCFVCGNLGGWKTMDAAHWIDRDQMPVRYDELNVHPCCQSCNRVDPNHKDYYHSAMAAAYGKPVMEKLYLRSKSLAKFTRYELKEIAEKYKNMFNEIKKAKKL